MTNQVLNIEGWHDNQEFATDADDEDAVNEEPVITIGVDGEKWDESENAEENSVSKKDQRTTEVRQRISKTRTRFTS